MNTSAGKIQSRTISLSLGFWLVLTALIGLVGVLRHEMWRDEADVWLVAGAPGVGDLLADVGFKGSPRFYYLAAWSLHQIWESPLALSLSNIALAILAIWFVYKSAPLSPLQAVLFGLGFYPLFQYGVIARPYALILVLIFAYCHFRTTRPDAIVWRFAPLAVLAQINLFSALAVTALVAYEMISLWRTRFDARIWIAAAGVGVSVLLAMWQMYPTGDTPRTTFGDTSLYAFASGIANGFVPNYGVLGVDSRLQRYGGMLIAVASVVALLRRPRALLAYALLAGSLGAISLFVYVGYRWHHGLYAVYWLVALWMSQERPLGTLAGRGLTMVLAVHVAMCAHALTEDFSRPYSDGPLVAALLREERLSELPIIGVYADKPPAGDTTYRWAIDRLQPILVHVPQMRAYDPVSQTFERHFKHYADTKHFPDMDRATMIQQLRELSTQLGGRFIAVEVGPPVLDGIPCLRLLRDFPEPLDFGEHYRVFLRDPRSPDCSGEVAVEGSGGIGRGRG